MAIMVTFNVKTKILRWCHRSIKSWCGGTEVHSNPTD